MIGRATRLLRDEAGSSIIEMGLVAPFLAAMLIGMVDLSRAYSTKLQLEQAAQRTIEKVQGSSYDPSDDADLRADAADAAGVAVANVTVQSWLQCNNSPTKQAFASSCNGSEPFARYIAIRIQKSYVPLFPVKWDNSPSGTWTVRGAAGIRVQ